MSQRIMVSRSGVNALSSLQPNDFMFHSDYNTFKIVATGTLMQTVSPSSPTLEVSHGLSYIPIAYAFLKIPSQDEVISPRFMFGETGDFFNVGFDMVSADSSKVYFQIRQFNAGSVQIRIRYYLFEVPL